MDDANAHLAEAAEEAESLEVASVEGFADEDADGEDGHPPADLIALAVALDTGTAEGMSLAAAEFAEAFEVES